MTKYNYRFNHIQLLNMYKNLWSDKYNLNYIHKKNLNHNLIRRLYKIINQK